MNKEYLKNIIIDQREEIAEILRKEKVISRCVQKLQLTTKKEKIITASQGSNRLFSIQLDTLKKAWQQPLQKVFT